MLFTEKSVYYVSVLIYIKVNDGPVLHLMHSEAGFLLCLAAFIIPCLCHRDEPTQHFSTPRGDKEVHFILKVTKCKFMGKWLLYLRKS